MSDAQSWYARRFQQLRGQPQQPLQSRQQQYNQPGYVPQPPAYPAIQQPQFQQPQYVQPQPQGPPPVTIDNLYAAAGYWHGGQAHQIDREPCPNCGSGQYFSRAVGKRGPPPAPHCYNCGYNDGMFTQGEPTTWGMTG